MINRLMSSLIFQIILTTKHAKTTYDYTVCSIGIIKHNGKHQ